MKMERVLQTATARYGWMLLVLLLGCAFTLAGNVTHAADTVADARTLELEREEAILAERRRLADEAKKRDEEAKAKEDAEADAKKRRATPNPFAKKGDGKVENDPALEALPASNLKNAAPRLETKGREG